VSSSSQEVGGPVRRGGTPLRLPVPLHCRHWTTPVPKQRSQVMFEVPRESWADTANARMKMSSGRHFVVISPGEMMVGTSGGRVRRPIASGRRVSFRRRTARRAGPIDVPHTGSPPMLLRFRFALAVAPILGLWTPAVARAQVASADTTPITVALHPVVPGKENLRWSPKGATVPLTEQEGMLIGSFPLGPAGVPPVMVRLGRTGGDTHYNTLWIDLDRNGRFDAGERLSTTPTLRRSEWWSDFDATVEVPMASTPRGGRATRPYPMALWFVEDTLEPGAEPALRWSRRGWHQGTVQIGGRTAWVLITEYEMDGVFDQRDAWAMSRDSLDVLKTDVRKLDEHVWLDSLHAYRPIRIDPDGRSLTFVRIQPGISEAEELAQRDIYLPDRNVPRAAKPVEFASDLSSALAEARRDHKRVLLDFEATWCGPCHIMDQLVFTAQSVVDAAHDVVAVKIDGDVHRDQKKAYRVDGYPTLILLDEHGTELRRGIGYQSVLQTVALLRP
jgi:thiol-disulfide isomerase/thioredoxin